MKRTRICNYSIVEWICYNCCLDLVSQVIFLCTISHLLFLVLYVLLTSILLILALKIIAISCLHHVSVTSSCVALYTVIYFCSERRRLCEFKNLASCHWVKFPPKNARVMKKIFPTRKVCASERGTHFEEKIRNFMYLLQIWII